MGSLTWLEWYRWILGKRVSLQNSTHLDLMTHYVCRAFDGKAKVWSIDQRACVATHTETDRALWSVKWLPKTGKNEGFATAGANRSISFYREATGGWVLPRTIDCTQVHMKIFNCGSWKAYQESIFRKPSEIFEMSGYSHGEIALAQN